MTLDDISRKLTVRARRRIEDVPTNQAPAVKRGDTGEVCDVDFCNEIAFVDFGHGAIACEPADLR